MKPIIEVNHVWKEYHKGIDRRYKSLRDTLVKFPSKLFGEEKEKFWALEDIDFKVKAGESVGIIGRNGAGKSTLLKILSRITPPTKGEIILRGRVASLLEVGTGFHPELTGRENVFFNGSILGMKSQEIKRKFDEIVEFSGVGNFIDTPLKHYSSGMQMRLAFSVAAHLDSEILLIDEVLAVGDAEFQKKCIGKMDDVSRGEGKTILFVSHDLKTIENLCLSTIVLEKSKLQIYTNSNDAIHKYFRSIVPNHELITSKLELENHKDKKERSGIQSVTVKCDGIIRNIVYPGCNLKIEIEITKKTNFLNPEVGFAIKNSSGEYLFGLNNNHLNCTLKNNSNKMVVIFEFKHFLIYKPGIYFYNLYYGDDDSEYQILMDVGTLSCEAKNYYKSTRLLDTSFNKIIDNNLVLYYY